MDDQGRRYQASKKLASVFSKNHPWVYRNALSGAIDAIPPGSLVRMVDGENRFMTHAIYEPHGSVAMRLLFTSEPFDAGQLRRRLAKIIAKKARNTSFGPRSAFRLLNGEGDRFPGLTCDVYSGVAVWQPYLKFWDEFLPALAEEADSATGVERHVVKPPSRREGRPDHYMLKGTEPAEPVVFEEKGLKLHAWPLSGQKSGFFLDLREVRFLLPGYVRGKNVLNCFAGTGAFTLIARSFGAASVLSIESDAKCAERAAALLEENALPFPPSEWVVGNVFDELEKHVGEGRKFDVVVLDPPNMCSKKSSLVPALKGWEKLLRRGKELTAAGGKMIAINCSSFMTKELCEGAAKELRLKAESFGGPPPDHTTRADFPEGDYLKWWVYAL
ncbi:MAG: class I SAM-dependent rRNA methyltransferase [Nitrospinae bacterium]|nr:class I SAM-dependent rRNA methyltransferase [Nitrospinota bacterium]